jgi:hypothetical protein
MNDKIKELAEQAGLMCLYDYGPEEDPHAMVVGQKDLELFAELIVKECAKYVKNTNIFSSSNQAELCAERMTRHFGVE